MIAALFSIAVALFLIAMALFLSNMQAGRANYLKEQELKHRGISVEKAIY